jgi:CIC family chloride channel protein
VHALVPSRSRLFAGIERLLRAGVTLAKHHELSGIIFWAALIGIAGAFSSVAFRASVREVQRLLTGGTGGLVETAEALPWWGRVIIPAIGGLCAGLLLWLGHRVLRSARSVDYMEAVAVGNGNLSSRAAILAAASSFFTIGSGGSIGREGPLVQLAAAAASKLGQWTRSPVPRLRLLVACGAAAGIAAAYNAPIAGALFVAEVVLGSIAMESFGPLIVASVVSDAVSRHFLGYGPVYQVPPLSFGAAWELVLYALLGVLLGHVAPTYLTLLDRARRSFRRLRWPPYVALTVGGLIVGVISVVVPQVWGNGYSVVNDILGGHYGAELLALVLVAKLVSTAATVGSGANGGILTPTLFVGAAVGALFGSAVHAIDAGSSSQAAAYALVGMGGFLAATTHAPLTSILLIFEMTLSYEVVLPLMLACVTGHYVARIYRRGESLYTRSLRARGPGAEAEWRLRTIDALSRPPDMVLWRDAPLADAIERLPALGVASAYVVDAQNRLAGYLDAAALAQEAETLVPASTLTVGDRTLAAPPTLFPQMLLGDALDIFLASGFRRLPVVSGPWNPVLLGEVSRHDLMLALADRMSERGARKSQDSSVRSRGSTEGQ